MFPLFILWFFSLLYTTALWKFDFTFSTLIGEENKKVQTQSQNCAKAIISHNILGYKVSFNSWQMTIKGMYMYMFCSTKSLQVFALGSMIYIIRHFLTSLLWIDVCKHEIIKAGVIIRGVSNKGWNSKMKLEIPTGYGIQVTVKACGPLVK